jgi:hypothetical protein
VSGGAIEVFDPVRLLRGQAPWSFVLEATVRLFLLFTLLVLAFRAMGHRMSSQMTRNELLALVALAAGVGPAIETPNRGLLAPVVLAAWIIVFQRTVARATLTSHRLEMALQGHPATLCASGTLDLGVMRKNAVSRERLFAELRGAGILHLGKVERVYLEPDGTFTVLEREVSGAGISVIPEWDPDLRGEQPASGQRACERCGKIAHHGSRSCDGCGSEDLGSAVSD